MVKRAGGMFPAGSESVSGLWRATRRDEHRTRNPRPGLSLVGESPFVTECLIDDSVILYPDRLEVSSATQELGHMMQGMALISQPLVTRRGCRYCTTAFFGHLILS
ncbi:hypothetical protein LIA77_03934 [Sarocladium implicatum]|nr:hypothetical protein LIA77_03934 [Sarocladium implicatum]